MEAIAENGRIKNLRITGIAEGISFLLLLFIAMPLKYFAGMPDMVTVVGWIHGGLFMLYFFFIARSMKLLKWKMTLAAMAASVIPFGTFVLDKKLKTGEWD